MNTTLLTTLRKMFPYLYEQGFTLLSSQEDNRLSSIEFGSTDIKLRFDILDGIVDIFVAANHPKAGNGGHWYGLATYIEYLEGHPIDFPGRVVFPPNDLKILSNTLETYMDRLRNLSPMGNRYG